MRPQVSWWYQVYDLNRKRELSLFNRLACLALLHLHRDICFFLNQNSKKASVTCKKMSYVIVRVAIYDVYWCARENSLLGLVRIMLSCNFAGVNSVLPIFLAPHPMNFVAMLPKILSRERFVTVPNGKLCYQEWETSHPRTLLLLHGMMQTSHTWDDVQQIFVLLISVCPSCHSQVPRPGSGSERPWPLFLISYKRVFYCSDDARHQTSSWCG